VIELVHEDPQHMYIPGLSSFLESLGKRGAIRSELGRLAEGAADVERALRMAEDDATPVDTLMLCLSYDLHRHPLSGAPADAAARARRFVQLAERSGNPTLVQLAQQTAGTTHTSLGSWDAAIAHLERSRELARERGMGVWIQPVGLASLADAYRALGQLADARVAATAGVDAGYSLRTGECRAQIALARVLIAEGATDTDAIDAALKRAEALVEETHARAYLPFVAEARAELARVRGDAAGATRALAEAQRLFTEMGAKGHAERVAALLAEAPPHAAVERTG